MGLEFEKIRAALQALLGLLCVSSAISGYAGPPDADLRSEIKEQFEESVNHIARLYSVAISRVFGRDAYLVKLEHPEDFSIIDEYIVIRGNDGKLHRVISNRNSRLLGQTLGDLLSSNYSIKSSKDAELFLESIHRLYQAVVSCGDFVSCPQQYIRKGDRWIFSLSHSLGSDEWTSIVVETDEYGQVQSVEKKRMDAVLFSS